jgi:hypothetical protein
MPQCHGFNRDGTRCRNEVLPGQNFCRITSHSENRNTGWHRVAGVIRSNPKVIVALTVISLAGIVLSIYATKARITASRQSTTVGTLEPDGTAGARYISFGSGWPKFEENNPSGIVAKDADDPILTVRMRFVRSARCLWLWRCKRQMLVSAKLKNADGDLVAEVTNNEWSLQARPAIFDRNYTDNILEIRDTKGRVSLQLMELGDTVYVAGRFICSHDRSTYTILPDGFLEMRPYGIPISREIPPVCEYPSALHLGQCASKKAESLIEPNSPIYPVKTPLQVCRDLAAEENRKAQQ